jgi:hypothetical protein
MSNRIDAQEKYLAFNGLPADALSFVESIRSVFDLAGSDMPKILNDFVFNIEVALQNEGILDDDFNLIDENTPHDVCSVCNKSFESMTLDSVNNLSFDLICCKCLNKEV